MSSPARHIVILNKFFNNYKQKAYIYIEKEFEYVKSLEDHIIKMFKLKSPIFLTNDNGIYYPPKERIKVIEPNDVLIAHPLRSEITVPHEREPIDDFFSEPKLKKIKRNSFQKGDADVEPMIVNQDSDDSVVLNVFNHLNISNSNNSEDGEDTKAKRKRIRKRKKNVVTLIDETKKKISNGEMEREVVIAPAKVFHGLHIRFDDDNNAETSEEKYDQEMHKVRKARVVRPFVNTTLKSEANSSNKVFQSINIDSTTESSVPTNESKSEVITETAVQREENMSEHEINALEIFNELRARSVLEEYPIIDYLPKVNDMISFRILKLDDNYVPQITKDIFGSIVSLDTNTKDIVLKILYGNDETKEPDGKFSLPTDDDSSSEATDFFSTNLLNLHEVRVIVAHKETTEIAAPAPASE